MIRKECMIFYYVYLFFIGASIASFASLVTYRLPRNEDIIIKRSYCINCHHVLSMLEMIPVISYIGLKGRCRYCHHKIRIQEVILECGGGLLLVGCTRQFGLQGFFIFLVCVLLFMIADIDYQTMLIPDILLKWLAVFSMLSLWVFDISIYERVAWMMVGLWMVILNQVQESFGNGDIKIVMLCGFMLGSKAMDGVMIAILCGGFFALYLLLVKKRKAKSKIPFAPFLSVGFVMSMMGFQLVGQIYLR